VSSAAVPGLADLVGTDPDLELLASGFIFTEGPVWHPFEHKLMFSDIPADKRWQWTDEEGAALAAWPSAKSNGMTYDAALNLIICEHSTSRLTRHRVDGRVEVLAAEYDGKQLNSPNDVIVAADGSIYFTDPTYGRNEKFGVEGPPQLDYRGVYRVSPDGPLELLADDFEEPNGLCLSPDESRLYVNDSPRAHIRAFELREDGRLGRESVFADSIGNGVFADGIVDGMKCDVSGNVWVTGPEGIWVFDPSGNRLGIVRIPELVGNFHWGGDDWSTLFVCASTGLYQMHTGISGRREPFMDAARTR
jgi:gluconolactonase